MSYIGWLLPEEDRNYLLGVFPPVYPSVRAHHVTLRMGGNETTPLPGETTGRVIGICDDGHGIQALVVQVGSTHIRPDGRIYHITWSLDEEQGYSAKMSNDAIDRLGWKSVTPIDISLEPMFFQR